MNQAMTTDELIELTSEQLLFRMDEIRHAAVTASVKWAELNKEFKDYKELLPSYLAMIQSAHLSEGNSASEAKAKALASQAYQNRIKAMNEAELDAEKARAEYRGLMASLEALKSIAYVRNAEIKLSR